MDVSDFIRVQHRGSHIVTRTYFHPLFIQSAKNMQGTWHAASQEWSFQPAMQEPIQQLLNHLWFVDGMNPYPVCTLLVQNYSIVRDQAPILLFNRPIVRVFGRDSEPDIQPDIYLLSGQFRSSGSQKNWRAIADRATFQIRNFPVAALRQPAVAHPAANLNLSIIH